jgi:hypothetical protein
MLITTILIWSFNITVTRYVLTHGFQPLAYGAIRYGLAALLAAGVALVLERSLRISGRVELMLILLASLFLLANQFSFVYALKLGTATTVALILGTTPIFAAIISSAVGLERLAAASGSRPRSASAASRSSRSARRRPVVRPGRRPARDHARDLVGRVLGDGCTAHAHLFAVQGQRRRAARHVRPFLAASSPQIADQNYASLSWLVWVCLLFAIVGPSS